MAVLLPLCQSLWLGRKVYTPVICNHCPPPPHIRGIAGTMTFHPNSPAKSPVLRGPTESHSPALYKSKFLGVYLRNITSPALTQYCGGTQKVIALHISPTILVGGGAGVTNDWCIMISPLATSLLRSRTVCWGKGKDCSEAGHDYLQAPVPLRTVQWPFQWGGSWQEVVIWGSFTVQLVLMSSVKTQTSYVSFIHIQHQF